MKVAPPNSFSDPFVAACNILVKTQDHNKFSNGSLPHRNYPTDMPFSTSPSQFPQCQATGRLQEALLDGARFDVMTYQDNNDREMRQAWQAIRHDAESNRFLQTSVEMKIKIVMNMKSRVAGGDWDLVTKDWARGLKFF